MIIIENISKSYNQVPAVRDLSITIKDSEIFGLVGPNGAGKTTTLKMMTGLQQPDNGRILLGGYDIVQEPVKAKSITGYVPDKAFMYEKLTGREFLIFIASIYGMKKTQSLLKITELLELFGIADVAGELIESYSQGMKQRLIFASALLHDPKVLLIDEPFVGLDPFGVKMIKGFLKDLSIRDTTIFLATHSLHIAEELCHRIGFIKHGTLIAIKTREEIRDFKGGLEELFMKLSG